MVKSVIYSDEAILLLVYNVFDLVFDLFVEEWRGKIAMMREIYKKHNLHLAQSGITIMRSQMEETSASGHLLATSTPKTYPSCALSPPSSPASPARMA